MSPGTEYYRFFTYAYEFSPIGILSLFLLTIFRLAPIVVFAPFLGAKLPSGVKMGILISFALVFLPHVGMTSKTAIDFNVVWIAHAIKELFIGFVLAFLVSVPFHIAQSAGVTIDFARGSSSLQVSDPFSQSQTSPLGNLYNYLLVVIFYYIGGPFLFFDSILESYSIIPADGFINPIFFTFHQPIWQLIMAVTTKVVAISVQLAAPALLACLMTDMFLGIANRLAPQVQIVFLGMSLKSLIGLGILCAAWFFILKQMEHQTLLWLKEVNLILYKIPK